MIEIAVPQTARVVKWQTRTFEGRMPQGVGVQVPPRAEEKIRLTKKDQTLADFCAIFEPTLTSILAAEFGIEPEAWAGSGAQPAKPYL